MGPQVRTSAIITLAGSLLCAGPPVRAEIHPGETRGLGLLGPDIPPVLKAVMTDPYRAPAAPACETIPAELQALNEALGPDADVPAKPRSQVADWMGGAIGGAVRGMVPYRGVVRFLTGAGRKDKALIRAVFAGSARRGFLRGVEANLRCAPAEQAQAVEGAPAAEVASGPARETRTLVVPGGPATAATATLTDLSAVGGLGQPTSTPIPTRAVNP